MIIKSLITLALLTILAFALLQRFFHTLMRALLSLAVLFGIWIAWSPDTATMIANFIGVGRGADLIFYLWILISIFVALVLYIRFSIMNRALTKLARHAALLRPIPPKTQADDRDP
jgi:small membrane protein